MPGKPYILARLLEVLPPALVFIAVPALVHAEHVPEHVDTRHGAVPGWQDVEVEGGLTTVIQAANDSDIDAELTASFDLVTTVPAGAGKLVVYLEGNTSPLSGGVSALLAESNADAGSALDRDGNGRLQVSELHYLRQLNHRGTALLGLVDPTVSLDSSEVANDETTQFLTSSLVNNPTIGFPDYTLGAIYNHEFEPNRGFSLILTSSHGLGDNPDASYAQLVDVGDDGKGVFAAAEVQWHLLCCALHGGVWTNTADHPELNGSADTEDNYGVYAVIDGMLGSSAWNIRVGAANEAVSQAARFASLAFEYPSELAALGAGIARSWLSPDDDTPGLDDATQVELYARFELRHGFSLTPSLQWLENSGFDASETVIDDSVIVYGLRANFVF